MYVGMTRAQERLILAHARRRAQMGMPVYNQPSRFLRDLPAHLTEGRSRSDDFAVRRQGRERALPRPGRVAVSAADVAAAIAGGGRNFDPGERVRHPKFGDGIVVSTRDNAGDQEVTVAFKGEAGVKRLMVSYARLERVS